MNVTTLQRLRDKNACQRGYDLIASHVGVNFNGEIPLEMILDHNGLNDCIWALRASDGGVETGQEFAIRCAMEAYFDPIWTAWALRWLDGTDRSKDAAYSAADAAYSAADAAYSAAYAAYSAAYSADAAAYAADAAADSAARSARATDAADAAADAAYSADAADAADAAARAAARSAARAKQTEILRKLISHNEE